MSDFTFSDELAHGLREVAVTARPLYELVKRRRPLCEDLSALPPDAEFVATRGTAAHLERLAGAASLRVVWANPVTPALLRALAQAPALEALYLYEAKKVDLAPLGDLRTVEHLMVSWAPQLSDISWLARLPRLRTLYLEDMKRLDLETLPELPGLESLYVGGGAWSTLKVDSLSPLTRLPHLKHLSLSNLKPADGSLAPVAALHELRELGLPNFFEVEECARLAAALPDAHGRILQPIFIEPKVNADGTPAFPCEKCGGPRLMLTGRPASLLCPGCDAKKIAKRVARWEAARTV